MRTLLAILLATVGGCTCNSDGGTFDGGQDADQRDADMDRGQDTGPDGDVDTDSDADTDVDTDIDSDTDIDRDVDSDTDELVYPRGRPDPETVYFRAESRCGPWYEEYFSDCVSRDHLFHRWLEGNLTTCENDGSSLRLEASEFSEGDPHMGFSIRLNGRPTVEMAPFWLEWTCDNYGDAGPSDDVLCSGDAMHDYAEGTVRFEMCGSEVAGVFEIRRLRECWYDVDPWCLVDMVGAFRCTPDRPVDCGLGGDGDADADADTDADADIENEMVPCAGGLLDPTSGLCWQHPPLESNLDWSSSMAYCEGLDLGGHGPGSWHLPTISELRSLIRGCPASETGGACGITDDCLGTGCELGMCLECLTWEGPGTGGAYWPTDLGVPVTLSWSASTHADDSSLAWEVDFSRGGIFWANKSWALNVRCVRRGP